MKKRLFTRLTCLTLTAAIVLSFSGFIYADETEEEILYESVIDNEEVTDVDQDNDYLAEQYIMSKMPTKNKRVNVKYDYINHLDTYDQAAYLSLIPYITEIASGTRTNTLFDVPELSFTLTNTQLGVADLDALSEEELKTLVKNNKPVHEDKVDEALINSFPYELYWYNRYYGLQMGYKAKRDKQNIVYYGFSFWFVVSEEYQLDGAANKVNSLFGQALTNAAKNVAKIIKDNAGLSDYEKLLAYNDTICQMTDYNHPAADNTSTPYGNPWQLVWIFDGDPNTMVVCEGFAKGFQYLCDNSVFRSDEVYVIPVKGTVMYNGQGGGHEWNIVHMDDGCNYLVDTTNSDGHLIDGHYTRLFMVGAQSGSVNGGYYVKFSDSNGVPNFTYFQDTIDFYGQAPLTLESSSYDPYYPHYVTVRSGAGGTAEVYMSESFFFAGDKINVTTYPDDGYEVDKITVNGKPIIGDWFYMPGRNAEVYVTFKKIDYKITVNTGEGGTVECPATAHYGDKVTLNVKPATGYKLDKITSSQVNISNNSFTMPAKNVTLNATFKKIDYAVTVNSGEGGTVNCQKNAHYGDKVSFTVTPDTGYVVDKITSNQVTINNNSFTMPAGNVTINVTFKKVDYTITVSCGAGGTIDVPATANYDDVIEVRITPNTGYKIKELIVNGTYIYPVSEFDFKMPAENITISVDFEKIDYSITVNTSEGGTVNCQKTAQYGDKVTFTVTPATGYMIDKISSDDVTIKNNSFTMPAGNVNINVTFKKIDYTITVNTGAGGTVNCPKTANYGDKVTISASPAAGYMIDKITSGDVTINNNSFTMPAKGVNISVTFKKIDYKITVSAGEGGTVNCQKTAQVGDKVTLTVTPNAGYTLDKITSDQVTVNNNGFTMPAGEVTVKVTFKKVDYTITVNIGEGGTAIASATGGNVGDKINMDCTPDTGYKLDKIKVNGTAINGNTFDMPAANVTVTVTFKKIDYTITVNSGENGSATAPASGKYNDKITVTCTPAKGYEVDSITVNGTAIEGNTFTMPAAAVTVEVAFRKALYELSISNTAGGSATLSATSAYYGDEITVDVSADDGYHLAAIKVNGKAIEGNKFAMPDGKTAVEVVFEKNEYKITASTATGGKVTLSASAAAAGTVITVKATADKGYELDKITYTPDGGKAVDITSAAKFTMPAKDVTVKVTFKKIVVKATLTLDKTSAKIVCGSTQTLKATLKNSSSKISWKSSDSKIASVDSNGKITAKQAGKVTITASAAGVSAACTVQVLFKDVVNEKDFWFTPTYYLVNKGVVKGYDNQTLFKPTNDCSRAQMITFLWRLQGEPAPKSSTNKFKDVKSSDYFYKASIWAVEQGITTVPSDKKFNPQGICTRAQTVTFLWRMAGKPTPKTDKCKFKDVKSSDYFYKATIWANEMKIVSGYDDGSFRPQGNCTRRQMVTFLYKYDKYVNGKG